MTSWRYLGDCVCSLLTYIHTKQTQGSVFVHQMFPCVHQLVVCWYKAVSIRFIRALWSERWKKKKEKRLVLTISFLSGWMTLLGLWISVSPLNLTVPAHQQLLRTWKNHAIHSCCWEGKKTRLMMFLRTCQRKYGEHSNQCEWDECSNIETT